MAEKQILGFGTGNAPRNRTTKDSEHMALLAVNATFDGSGAAGDFVPTVVVISDSGEVVGRFPCGAAVAAGDNAEVTFAPFLRNDTGLTGIFYNIANVGGTLDVKTTSGGMTFRDASSTGIGFRQTGTGGIYMVIDNFGGLFVEEHGGGINIREYDSGTIAFEVHGAANSGFAVNVSDGGPVVLNSLGAGTAGGVSIASQSDNGVGEALQFVIGKAGATLTVYDHSGNKIFQVNEDGSLHGKTGKALTFDL